MHRGFIRNVLGALLIAPALLAQTPDIGKRMDLGVVRLSELNEISGIAASRQNRGVLWVHNDSGDRNAIYALSGRGTPLGGYEIVGASARDWEDIAVGPGPQAGKHYIYIGDIGDNDAEVAVKTIYRVIEPRVLPNQPARTVRLFGAQHIRFTYPDGNRDAEALMVDPLNRDIYVISKRERFVHVYHAPYPQPVNQVFTIKRVGTLPFSWAVAGDISASGREILVKTYDAVYYWRHQPGRPLWRSLARKPAMLPYFLEPQGESIAWRGDDMGYFTLSEVFKGIPAHLYFYPRRGAPPTD